MAAAHRPLHDRAVRDAARAGRSEPAAGTMHAHPCACRTTAMYLPPHFAVEDPVEVLELLRTHPLATLVTHDAAGLDANPVVLLADAGPQGGLQRLRGHVARANDLWRRAGTQGCEVLVLFHGPQAYVSPSAHPRKALDGKVVPTWNYVVVQVAGTLRAVDDPAWVRGLVGELTELHESGRDAPWALRDAPQDYLQSMVRGVVGIDIEVTRVQAKFKLSQNHPRQAQLALAQALQHGDEAARDIAARMLRGD